MSPHTPTPHPHINKGSSHQPVCSQMILENINKDPEVAALRANRTLPRPQQPLPTAALVARSAQARASNAGLMGGGMPPAGLPQMTEPGVYRSSSTGAAQSAAAPPAPRGPGRPPGGDPRTTGLFSKASLTRRTAVGTFRSHPLKRQVVFLPTPRFLRQMDEYLIIVHYEIGHVWSRL